MQNKNPLQWDVQQNSESLIVHFFGDLNRNTLLPLWKQRAAFLSPKEGQQIYWNLQGLTSLDSAGFTLFAELLNQYQKTNANCVINPPENLRKLAELFDLTDWLFSFLCSEKKESYGT